MDVSRLINLGWCASTPLTDGLKTAYADVVGKQRAYCGFINSEQPTLNKWGLPDRRFETAQPSCKVQGIKSRYLKKTRRSRALVLPHRSAGSLFEFAVKIHPSCAKSTEKFRIVRKERAFCPCAQVLQ